MMDTLHRVGDKSNKMHYMISCLIFGVSVGCFKRETRQRSTEHCSSEYTHPLMNMVTRQPCEILVLQSSNCVLDYLLQLYLANIRLKNAATDVVITGYEALLIK